MPTFEDRAVILIDRLLAAFPYLTPKRACGIAGNGGGESDGLRAIHEFGQPVNKGGYGWFQWTGPRRIAFFAACKRYGLKWTDEEANIRFLIEELQGPERNSLAQLMAGPDDVGIATEIFEKFYERAGVTAIARRKEYAARAWAAWVARRGALVKVVIPVLPKPEPLPQAPPEVAKKVTVGVAAGGGAAVALAAGVNPLWLVGIAIAAFVLYVVVSAFIRNKG